MLKESWKLNRTRCVAASVVLAVSLPVAGSESSREHGSHAHGEGVLEVALDGEELVMALRIPAVNVVGFEHAATNPEQRRQISDAITRFSKGGTLFAPSEVARCEFEHARVELAGMSGGDGKPDSKHSYDHGKKHDHEADDGHSELSAEYHFHCHSPERLTAIQVDVFKQLLDAESIDAHVVTAGYQGSTELTPDRTTVKVIP